MGANKPVLDIMDVKRHGFELGVQCWCGHSATLDAEQVWRWFLCHGWDTGAHACTKHFRCLACWRRGEKRRLPIRIGLGGGVPVDHGRFPKNPEGWKALVRRLRG